MILENYNHLATLGKEIPCRNRIQKWGGLSTFFPEEKLWVIVRFLLSVALGLYQSDLCK
jgi:hypothetical protein